MNDAKFGCIQYIILSLIYPHRIKEKAGDLGNAVYFLGSPFI